MEGRTFARTTNFGGRAMTEKLLNCPFCGGAAQSFEAPSVEGWHHVGCGPCQATSGCRQTEAEAIAAWNARPGADEAVREAEDRGYKRAVKMVAALVADAMVYSDSYGVQGSDFLCCMACNAGGAPGVPFEHSEDCIVLKCETIADDSWQEQRDELNWLNEENDKLRAELTALRARAQMEMGE